jgi:small subunit ribosomal protein S16
MVKIRLTRAGAKKRPYYRVIAIDSRKPRDGRALEFLGTYDPMSDPSKIKLETSRIEHWMSQGAQLSNQVKALMKQAKNQPAAPASSEA